MKLWIVSIFLLYSLNTQIHAETVIHEPKGEYAKIRENIRESSDLLNILTGKTKGDKAKAAIQAEKDLGSQVPPTIVALGNYYLFQGDFEKAALYHRLAMFRASVDIHASNDESLGDAIQILYSWIQEAISKLRENDLKTYADILKIVTKKIISLDNEIPRNYDIRWASLHSIKAFTNGPLNYPNDEGLQKIIEKEREIYIASAKKDGCW